ncbi:MAG TPA: hypothetical protein VGR37_18990, partial [Longimicrobiaceae bacterium]|nr:hypothetical protein [Longimicrobiaceae bacterium]
AAPAPRRGTRAPRDTLHLAVDPTPRPPLPLPVPRDTPAAEADGPRDTLHLPRPARPVRDTILVPGPAADPTPAGTPYPA